ncbi:MAG TPA: hypothetical protein VE591_15135, partial [Candidatus Acidoferrum sp.]|nr:hypothetical protein [Candidatus Acidoferrum sp.]
GYVVATALAAYAHVFAGLLVFAHALALLTDRRTARLWPRFAICVAAIVFALVPLLGLILGNETKSPGWITRPGSMELAFVFVMFAGSLPVLVVEVALIVNALRFGVGRWEYRFLLAWLLVPIVVAFCVSQVKPVFAPRYLSIAFIPFVLLVADGAARLRPAFGIAAIALIAAFSARTIARSYLAPLEDWRSAVAFVNTHGASRDGELLYHAHVATPERYYRARLPNARAGPTLVYPSPDRYVFWAAYPDGSDPLRSVFSHFAGERLWLVVSFSENDDPEVFDEVRALESGITERGFRCSERQRFRRITVLRYDRHPAATRQAAPVRCGGDRG